MISTLKKWFSRRSIENPKVPLSSANILEYLGTPGTDAGVPVDETSALRFSAVFAALRIRAEAIGVLPFKVYRIKPDGTKEEARSHPAWSLLHDRPHPRMTPATWKKTLQSHVDGWGNGRSRIIFNGAGKPSRLDVMRPDWTEVMHDVGGDRLLYKTKFSENGKSVTLEQDEVLDIPGIGFDGIKGYSILANHAKQTISTALAAEQFRGRFFKNGAWFAGGVRHPATLSDDAKRWIKNEFKAKHQGSLNSWEPLVLQEGMEWFQVSLPQEDALMLMLTVHAVRDVARIFRIPLHMLADMEKGASFASVEQVSQDLVRYTLSDPITAWQEECSWKLLGKGFTCEFVTDAFLRADTESRFKSYRDAKDGGIMSTNELRRKENLPPVKGGDGLLIPLNHALLNPDGTITTPGQGEEVEEQEEEAEADGDLRERVIDAHRSLLVESARRLVKTECERIRRHSKREDFGDWSEKFYRKQAGAWSDEMFGPCDAVQRILRSGPAGDRVEELAGSVRAFALEESDRARSEVQQARSNGSVSALLDEWENQRASAAAERLLERIAA